MLKTYINVNGFSPYQIVLVRNSNLPSMYNDKPLADLPRNKIIIEHLLVLHVTRQTFIATELSKKLKTALQKKTRQDHGSWIRSWILSILQMKWISEMERTRKSCMTWRIFH